MERGGGVHTVPDNERQRWLNKLDGQIQSRHKLKEDAVRAGRRMAELLKVEHTIHNQDGEIGKKNSYGNDPGSSKG